MPPKLELRKVEKRFDDVRAVAGLSLSLASGEFVSLLGPSGCGKSTTLAMIAGFESPTAGEILVDGTVVDRLAPQRRKIGLVFQDYAVFSRLSVQANLGFGLEAKGVARPQRRRAVTEMAERLRLTPILDRRGDRLNMSEMQRVALARALLTEPELLLLDEPMSNLDAALRADLGAELKQIQMQVGQTVLYVTHDQVEAMSLSDRIAVMHLGKLQQVGTPDEIYSQPRTRFVAEFIGDPPINLLPCDVQISAGDVAVTTAGHRLALGRGVLSAGRHLLGIRPYDARAMRSPDSTSAAATVRFVENLGAEHVLHVEYGDQLVRVVAPPGFAAEGERVHIAFDARRAHLIDGRSGDVIALAPLEAAA
ncbi:MAG: ABC transporter ATP-binding protein [Rhodospirillales bacterium]|nr:ABC transporter ATP-binding protein [Rhodospirillales bacterium]